jgi:sugar/nucleoside kinase (ribokinase family)
MSLTVVGSVALDTVEIKGQRHDDLLGGSASFFATAASYFTPVQLVAVVGNDFPGQHTDFFATRKIDLAGLERAAGQTFRWSGRYSDDLASRTTLETHLNVFAEFRPKLPEAWRDSEFLFLGNILPALQLDVLTQVKRPRLVAMDTMNLWIGNEPQALARVLAKVDLLVINDEEARQLSQEHNLPRAARAIRAMGPKTIIVKRGDSGALLFHEHGVFAAPAYPLEEVVDPTGAGDTFAGGFMGHLAQGGGLSRGNLAQALAWGTVMASFTVEAFSVDGICKLSRDKIENRRQALLDMVRY